MRVTLVEVRVGVASPTPCSSHHVLVVPVVISQ